MSGIILQGGHIVDPINGRNCTGDIGILDGKIVDPTTLCEARYVDVAGKIVSPGLIDIHVHLREPGQTHKEDIRTGTAAAAAGGFTTIVAMPNTIPAIDSVENFRLVQQLIQEKACVNVVQSACLSQGRKGEKLTDFAALKSAGVIVLTDDGTCIQNNHLMLEALRQTCKLDLPVSEHCEEESLAAGGVMNEGKVCQELGLPGKNRTAEEMIVARDIVLARETGAAIHIQHISSATSVQMIREAQKEGIRITAEATPHHILGTDEWVKLYGVNAKMNPPLCLESDRQAIIAGLADQTICCIATDHAPHTASEKAVGMLKAPAGIVGIEVVLPICLTELYHKNFLTLTELIACFTSGPRKVIPALTAGTLSIGADADIVIFDQSCEQVIDVNTFKSKGRNCPYHGLKVRGKVLETIVKGKTVYRSEG